MIMACNGLQDCSKVQVTEFPNNKTAKDFCKREIAFYFSNNFLIWPSQYIELLLKQYRQINNFLEFA